MTDTSAKQHYKNLLAQHYSWMFGDFDQQVEKNRTWFKKHNIHAKSGECAIDFGCGSGFQSIALSSLGFNVTAVDFNQELLDELKKHDETGNIRIIQSDILKPENFSHKAPFDLAVCMGDTLPHLPSEESIYDFFCIAHDHLTPKGNLILSFRDYSVELTGVDRFIPVQNDPNKIMTVFLEYKPDSVFVHDLVYVQDGDDWKLEKSVYKKVRLSTDKVKNLLEEANFTVRHVSSDQGMVYLIAAK